MKIRSFSGVRPGVEEEIFLSTCHPASPHGQPVLITRLGRPIGREDIDLNSYRLTEASEVERRNLIEAGYVVPDAEGL